MQVKKRKKSTNIEDRRRRKSAFTKKGETYQSDRGISLGHSVLAAYINTGIVKPFTKDVEDKKRQYKKRKK